jgi:hypothetical protein
MRKTIVMLCAKRCGSTAIHNMFRKHPQTKICHVDQNIKVYGKYIWEPNYWTHSVEALNGFKDGFVNKFSDSLPFLNIPDNITEETIFELWNNTLDFFGGIVADKSPQYLGNKAAMDLLAKYREMGNDVRVFAFIRNPLDAITSQFILWAKENINPYEQLRAKEESWLNKYAHLEKLIEDGCLGEIPLFKYEDFTNDPCRHARDLLTFCGLDDNRMSYSHIKPVHVGRYEKEKNEIIRRWQVSDELKKHMQKYGYA